MYNPCEYCQYSSLVFDSIGHDYYQCCLDDNPDLYSNAMCCINPDDLQIDLEINYGVSD